MGCRRGVKHRTREWLRVIHGIGGRQVGVVATLAACHGTRHHGETRRWDATPEVFDMAW